MFKKPLSFKGRIRRTEFGLSLLLGMLGYFLCVLIVGTIDALVFLSTAIYSLLFALMFFPVFYFLLAQAVKRSHDLGVSFWYLFYPLYWFKLIYTEGSLQGNKYGANPKEISRDFEEGPLRNIPQKAF